MTDTHRQLFEIYAEAYEAGMKDGYRRGFYDCAEQLGARVITKEDRTELVRVVAPHFVAGMIQENDIIVRAAPILRWTVGLHRNVLRAQFRRKGWRAAIIP